MCNSCIVAPKWTTVALNVRYRSKVLLATLHLPMVEMNMAEQKNTLESGHNAFRVEVVTTPQQFLHVMGVRAICYTEDTQFPMDQAIDGNDYQCTHVIAYLGDEPIGAGRIRWFKDFAKIERTAFRPRFREMSYLKIYANFVFSHIAKKGYARAITHASPKYARLWRIILGMKLVNKPAATYFGEEYVELVKELEVPQDAITSDSSVELLFRTEGTWERTGRYETVR